MNERDANALHPVILYDGDCGLCDHFVQFVLHRDPSGVFRFAALQSEYARRALSDLGLSTDDFNTIVVIENGVALRRSTAALRIVRRLRAPWPVLYAFIWVPRPVRDFFYRRISRNRRRFFTRPTACGLPKPGWIERFIESPIRTPTTPTSRP